jgi:outer membrane receptor for Fe3+-dicitrate
MEVKLLLPEGEYNIDISSRWYEDDYNVDFYRNFTLMVDSDNSIQQDIKLHPSIYDESTWNYLKGNFEGSLHKENVFNHYTNTCTVGEKYNAKKYTTKNRNFYISLYMFCTKEFNPEIESIKVISSVDAILTTNTGPIPLEANIERNIQLNLTPDYVNLNLESQVIGSHTFQILEL